MKVSDLYRFKKPLVHYMSHYEGRLFVITDIKLDGKNDLNVYEIKMTDSQCTWVFTEHELKYIAEKIA